jgi:hypothetical protein
MEKKVYKCLVASPGDTADERLACIRIFDEINQGIGEKFGFFIEKRMWEYNTRPGFGEYSQAVISQQLGSDYDVFVGVMNSKFGTETKNAGSGTEEEFNLAYDRLIKKEEVSIMFYFNSAPIDRSSLNLDQLNKVDNFKQKVGNLGGYHWSYNGALDFENKFRIHITSHFLSLYPSIRSVEQTTVPDILHTKFKERLDNALRAFSSQPIIWIDPILSNTNEISQNPDENYTKRINVSEIIKEPSSLIINAPAQFGLTCLAHYMVLKAWENKDLWLYLDANDTKPHNIHNAVIREVEAFGKKMSNVSVIILDSLNSYENDSLKKLKNISDAYKGIHIIAMRTIDPAKFLTHSDEIKIARPFGQLHLLALPRTQIRKMVAEYNKVKELGAEDKILSKVVSDLDVLNIHRTPLNCFTLLKAAEKYPDESPINRTDMIWQVLFVLFNMDGVARHRTKPDLKDCEYILSRYCEKMIRADYYSFTREEFVKQMQVYCQEKLIDIEVDVVFDILAVNNIIIRQEMAYAFRSSYWIFYFAARRMHSDSEFASYIFSTKKYTACPEIIEFYTGIDRDKVDALRILTSDIRNTCNEVSSKVALSGNIDIFSLIEWKPTEQQIQNAQEQLSETVINSGLPEEIKDQYADRSYNQLQPYNQSIQTFFAEYSVHNLIRNIIASSRALRNSDYVSLAAKREMLNEIMRSWEQISNVLLALTPILAAKGRAGFDGADFELQGDFGDTMETRTNRIIQVNMTNVVGYFKDDIYSGKIAPLFYEYLTNEKDANRKHRMILLLIFCRPREWRKHVEAYIISLSKNSFYLWDTHNALLSKYNFDFVSEDERREILHLIKMGFAKHEFGSKRPGAKEIAKIKVPKPKSAEQD